MAGVVSAPMKTHKIFFLTQISLRILSFAASLAAAWMMLTNKQNALVYGIWVSASYSYSSAFKFFAYANIIACAFSVVSLFLASIFGYTEINPTNYFAMFVHDLIITVLLMAGCAGATAIGFVGKYGVSEAGWLPLCDHFPPFCNRGAAATTLSYFSVVFYMVLTIISAKKIAPDTSLIGQEDETHTESWFFSPLSWNLKWWRRSMSGCVCCAHEVV